MRKLAAVDDPAGGYSLNGGGDGRDWVESGIEMGLKGHGIGRDRKWTLE